MVNISSLHLLLFQSSSDKDLGIHLFVGSHRHLVDTAKADHLGNKVARFTNGQCTRFSFLRPMFDPYDRLWLYVKEYIGHPLGHMGFQRAPKPPPKIDDPLTLSSVPTKDNMFYVRCIRALQSLSVSVYLPILK